MQPITERHPESTATHRLDAGPVDVAQLTRLLRRGLRAGNERFGEESHLSNVIPKPWGYEYRAYVDDFFDFWALHIDAPHGTSMHVHPRKLTYLICLAGTGVTWGLTGKECPIGPGSMVRIGQGAFHATRNTGDEPLELIEVEAPRNKYDLVRLQDDYNRAGVGYESQSVINDRSSLRPVPSHPHTEMRDRTPDGRFRFQLRTGMDIFYRRRAEDMFYVPLCISGIVVADLDILLRGEGRRPQTDKEYLCVSRAA